MWMLCTDFTESKKGKKSQLKTKQKLTICTSCFSQLYLQVFFRLTKKTTMTFIHLWKKKRFFLNNPIQSYQLYLIKTYSGVDLKKTQSCKNTLTGLFELGVKTLVFCVECRTTLVVEMSLCTTRYLYICKHVQ